jgi:hypothetical protein
VALHDNPRHRVTSYTSTSARDGSGGTTTTYTLAQSDIAVSINTASSSTRELYSRRDIVVTHTVGVLTAKLTTAWVEGMKLVTDDRSESYKINGLRGGRQSPNGAIPALTYADCEQLL